MLSNNVWNFYSNLDWWLNVRFNSRCISSRPHQYTRIHIYRYHLYYINIYSGKERKMNVLLIEFEVNLVYKIAKDCFSISKILSNTLFPTRVFFSLLSSNCLKHSQQLIRFHAKHLGWSGESDISYLIGFAICDYYYFDSSIKLLLGAKLVIAFVEIERREDNHQLLPINFAILQSDIKDG